MKYERRRSATKAALLGCLTALTLMPCWRARAGESAGAPETAKSAGTIPQPSVGNPWKNADFVLEGTVVMEAMPVSDSARFLSHYLSNRVDILTPEKGLEKYRISLRLRNATVSELFSAMNRIFEVSMTPLRWEMTMKGSRPTAVLHVIENANGGEAPGVQGHPAIGRRVIYVGDLLGDEKRGGMTMAGILDTLMETYAIAYGQGKEDLLQCHAQAELIIVKGTLDEIRFITDTVEALKQKVQRDQKVHHD